MSLRFVDVWDVKTFDAELIEKLSAESDLIRNYVTTDNKIFLTHDRSPDAGLWRPVNPFAKAFLALQEAIGQLMESRTIRAWHYTRLTETEVQALKRDGIHLSTLGTLRARLNALVAFGGLTAEVADALHARSPFHNQMQQESRSSKFWMVSHPVAIEDSRVKPLMAHWGGEAASMWVLDQALLKPLAVTGKPRVVELAVPLALTGHASAAARAVVAAFGRRLGCSPAAHEFDLYVAAPLGPESVLFVHVEGDASFEAVGRTYPHGYVDVSIGHWKELTGED